MAKKLLEGIEQELTCAVCLDRFKEPKVLPCLHTYCKDCVEAMVAKSREKDAVVCPKCRERYTLPGEGSSGFLSNFTLMNLLELLEVHETAGPGDKDSAKVLRCENGVDENVAVARCLVCCAYLCETCWKLHTKWIATRNHETVSLEEIKKGGEKKLHKPQYCPEHEKEVLKLYCKTCSKAICGDCTFIDHRDHKYAFIKDVQQELRQELEGTMEGLRKKEGELSEYLECLQRAQAEQEANVQACRQEVNRAFDSFVQRIQLCRDRVLEEVEKAAIADKKLLSAEADVTEVSLAKVSSNLSFIDRLLKSGSDTEVASMAAPTLERVKTVQGMKCEQKPAIVSGTLVAQGFKEVGLDVDKDFGKHVGEMEGDLVSVAQGKTDLLPNDIVIKGLKDLTTGPNTLTISVAKKNRKYVNPPFQLSINVIKPCIVPQDVQILPASARSYVVPQKVPTPSYAVPNVTDSPRTYAVPQKVPTPSYAVPAAPPHTYAVHQKPVPPPPCGFPAAPPRAYAVPHKVTAPPHTYAADPEVTAPPCTYAKVPPPSYAFPTAPPRTYAVPQNVPPPSSAVPAAPPRTYAVPDDTAQPRSYALPEVTAVEAPSLEEKVMLTVGKTSDSSWTVSFLLGESGPATITVLVNGIMAAGSPFVCQVSAPVLSVSKGIPVISSFGQTSQCSYYPPIQCAQGSQKKKPRSKLK